MFAKDVLDYVDNRFIAVRKAHGEEIPSKFHQLTLVNSNDPENFLDTFERLHREMKLLNITPSNADLANKLLAKINRSVLTLNVMQKYELEVEGVTNPEPMGIDLVMKWARKMFQAEASAKIEGEVARALSKGGLVGK